MNRILFKTKNKFCSRNEFSLWINCLFFGMHDNFITQNTLWKYADLKTTNGKEKYQNGMKWNNVIHVHVCIQIEMPKVWNLSIINENLSLFWGFLQFLHRLSSAHNTFSCLKFELHEKKFVFY